MARPGLTRAVPGERRLRGGSLHERSGGRGDRVGPPLGDGPVPDGDQQRLDSAALVAKMGLDSGLPCAVTCLPGRTAARASQARAAKQVHG
jgi:hypothetical protein